MSGPVSKWSIVDCCLNGVHDAAQFYDEISGGIPLNEAPESLIQTEILRQLARQCHFVTVESSVQWLLSCADAERRGQIVRNKSGRIDIVVWHATDTPRYLIEVKKAWGSFDLNSDAHRLRRLLGRGGTFHKGLLVAYLTAAKTNYLHHRLSKLAINSETKLLNSTQPKRIDPMDDSSRYWSAAVFEV